MKFINKLGEPVVEEGEPDWSKWTIISFEPIVDDDANVDMVVTCRELTENESADLVVPILEDRIRNTDGVIGIIVESQVTGTPISDENAAKYAEIIEQRQKWRAKIEELTANDNDGGE